MMKFITVLCLSFLVIAPASAESLIQTSAKQAIVVDYITGNILLEKSADEKMPTSSMSKTMTAYIAFEALKKGDIKLTDTFMVSEKAWRKGGSKMFVEVDKRVSIEDLLRGIVIQSGNDATIVLAEGIAGSEDKFAETMTAKAHELGMKDTNFANASGWPDPNHYSTARDLATMTRSLIFRFPQYYKYYGEQEFTYNNITQKNRNPLLYRNIGADGVKTGHTEAAGYGVIGSGVHNGRRVIVVVNGLEDEKGRAQESAKLLEWGLKRFENLELFKAGTTVESAAVALGKDAQVAATIKDDLQITVPKIALKDFKITANFKEPIIAPVKEGDEIGTLVIDVPHMQQITKPLYAANNVEQLGFFSAAIAKAKLFIAGGK